MKNEGLKFIFWFNLMCLIVVISAYITELALGLFLQFFLGLIQIAIAFIVNADLRKSSHLIILLFKVYKVITSVYVLIFILNFTGLFFETFESRIFIALVPMLIATYQVYINYLAQK
jgi:hypothetical protein|tara:strand:+ start:194 stop:544 length:351 start_codon:yes stop_codon:yes gene_type:complete